MSDEKNSEKDELKKLHNAVAKMLADFDKRLSDLNSKPNSNITKELSKDEKCFFCNGTGCFVCK